MERFISQNRRLLLLVMLLAVVIAIASSRTRAEGGSPVQNVQSPASGEQGVEVPWQATQIPADRTTSIQRTLSSYGYTIAVDGIYGPQTTKVVKSWQKSNGLLVDGIAGPITQASLGLSSTGGPTSNSDASSAPSSGSETPSIPHYDQWVALAQCESGGNWSINTGNGYYGGLQFALSSWKAVGGSNYPHQASATEQMLRAEALLDIQGWKAWPACSRKLGLR